MDKAIDMNDEFAKAVLSETPEGGFQASAFYDPHGDTLEFIATPECYNRERIDDLVTVYIGCESGQVVGSLIKGVKLLLGKVFEANPGAAAEIRIEDGRVLIKHLFRGGLWTNTDSTTDVKVIGHYTRLLEIAEREQTEAQLQTC